ncbi:PREDICTED: probable tRNA methyltransferase 9-like protein [Gavialis gangeticus]|uniref:probable tRNA methyltransferase 9-like protein n=1 Tax=Gavialis gangeticus TaxID=94835 RepID=UPI00092F6230|nr:PREDICTED: probable tRNA methyltransferase 9-like protein [Gavialis gangeticus]
MEHEATQLEKQHVHSVYESTASYFNDLQSKAWPRVRQFLLEQKPGSLIADIGCGTGKYLTVNSQVYNLGCDYCGPLVEISKKKDCEVLVCDNLNLPFRDQCFNTIISIGVIHHFSTKQRRIKAIKEMARVLMPGGQMMIYVWAMEQKNRRFEKQDVFVPWNRALCSRPFSESNQTGDKNELNAKNQDIHLKQFTGSECTYTVNPKLDFDSKHSHSTDHCLPGTCCMKMSEEENRFYRALGRSFRLWFFSRSLDESALRKQPEKVKQEKNIGRWTNSAISIQPSRHCSLDLGHPGPLLKERSLDDDEVFLENVSLGKTQWMAASNVTRSLSGEHDIQSKHEEISSLSGPMEDKDCSCTCKKDEDDKSPASKLFKRTSTTDSTDSILDAAVAVGDQTTGTLDTKAFMRYYHVFREGELCCLVGENVPELQILSSCYDHGNWCIIAEKLGKSLQTEQHKNFKVA